MFSSHYFECPLNANCLGDGQACEQEILRAAGSPATSDNKQAQSCEENGKMSRAFFCTETWF
jgi:hypothetical protein